MISKVEVPPTRYARSEHGIRNVAPDPDWRKLLGWGWAVMSETPDAVYLFHEDRPRLTFFYRKGPHAAYVVSLQRATAFATPEKAHNYAVRATGARA